MLTMWIGHELVKLNANLCNFDFTIVCVHFVVDINVMPSRNREQHLFTVASLFTRRRH